ncbi:S-layer homology domain-containing protein [Paenibacillus sinopodophylli]|uniref:S-layer homology domain-containing protein n=1 Tax=Paenibacillus sinopodophylli TaxID=1837342 RepID=UPI00110CCFC7|nr:S-layer homology domain-containing protein [Paenibacillus sinopodophylli]
MSKKFAGRKILIGAIAFSLVAGSGVIIPTTHSYVSAATLTTPFKDVASGHWAEKHIAKLALQKIIEGNTTTNGTFVFRPSENVSQQEAVLMALRFAGLDKQADQDAIIGFPTSFSVSAFFKSYVMLAFEEGLLDQQEEYELASKDTKIAWGTKPASREWVTKLMVRAIGQKQEALDLQNTASSFSDASQINSLYKGYINLAAKLDLVKGVTAVKFDPKANVTRASLATMFSRAEKQYPVAYEGQVNGVISRLTDTALTIYHDKKETTYTLDADTLFYHYNTEIPITKQQLLEYGDVTLIAKDGKAQYVEVNGDKVYTSTVSGTLGRVVANEKKIYVWDNDDLVEVYYNDLLSVVDTDGKALALSSIKTDSPITITQDSFREKPLAIKVVAASQASATSAKGTFYGTDGELITIMQGTALVSKFMADTVTLEIEGLTEATVGDLIKEADEVELTLNDADKVTKIKVVNRNVKSLAGAQIASFVYDKKLLTVVDASGGNAQALYFTDKTRIEYSGNQISLSSATNLLTQNRKIVISYTGNAIVSLQFVTKYTGQLVSMNASTNLLTVKLDNGASVSLPYSNAIVEHPVIANAALSDLKAGDLLTLELNSSQDKVATIKSHATTQYEVLTIDSVGKKLRVKNATTTAFDLSVGNTELVNEAGAKLTVDQITPGTLINVNFVGKQAVTARTVAATFGRVQAVSASSVTVIDLVGQTVVYNVDGGFTAIKGASQNNTTTLIAVGDYVEVQKFDGSKTQISVAVGESRIFTTYNLATAQIWTEKVSDADNRNYFNVNSNTKYFYNGNVTAATAFKAGDAITIYGFRNFAIAVVKP